MYGYVFTDALSSISEKQLKIDFDYKFSIILMIIFSLSSYFGWLIDFQLNNLINKSFYKTATCISLILKLLKKYIQMSFFGEGQKFEVYMKCVSF